MQTKKQTGKQVFDRTPYIRELFIGSDGIAKVKTPDGTRVLTSEDIAGLNNALLAKFNAIGNEEGAQKYSRAIDNGPWPVTITSGDKPTWVTEFETFLESVNLTLTPYISNETTTERTRQWQITTPESGYFGGKLARTIRDYMLVNNLRGLEEKQLFEEFDADFIVTWIVYLSTPRK